MKARHVFFAALGLGAATLALAAFRTPALAEARSLASADSSECYGCEAESPAPTASTGFEVAVLTLGQAYDFELVPGSGWAPGGDWSAVAGTINADGVYTAPKWFPPDGLDIVAYVAPDGGRIQTTVRLFANESEQPEPWVTVPDGFFDEPDARSGRPLFLEPGAKAPGHTRSAPTQDQRDQWAREQWGRRDWLKDNVPDDGKWHMLRRSSDPAPTQVEVTDLQPIQPDGGLLPVPTYSGGAESSGLAIRASGDGPSSGAKKGKVRPQYDPPEWVAEPCRDGKVRGRGGDVGVAVQWGPNVNPAGRFRVSASMSAKLMEVFGIDIKADTEVEFGAQVGNYHAWQNFDRYRCINGRWVFDGKVHCDRYAMGVRTLPPWVAKVFYGLPGDGGPGEWSPQSCYSIP